MANHSLHITDRGMEHVHRWRPSCSCGWGGIAVKTKPAAAREYRQHRKSVQPKRSWVTRGGRRRRAVPPVGPRPLTPREDLPPELQ